MSQQRKRHKASRPERLRRRMPPGTAPGTLAVDPAAPRPVIRVIAYDAEKIVERDVEDPGTLEELLGRWPVTWVNVDGLGDAGVLERIGAIFGIHRLALEDVVNVDQRAKVEDYDDNLFVVARMASMDERVRTEQISMFLGRKFVLTFQESAGDCFDTVRARIRSGRKKIRSSGPDYLLYSLLDALIDGYFPILERLGDRLETLEEEVHGDPGQPTVAEIHSVKNSLLVVRRAIWPHREALRQLQHEEKEYLTSDTEKYLRDCYDHTVQIIELVENYRETCSDLRDSYMSQMSNRMNEIMKVLTIIATIFIPLGFIAGVYGMNFDPAASFWNMPELSWHWGYPFALVLMAVVAVGLLVFFKRKGWLG